LETLAPGAMILLLWTPNAIVLGFALWILRRSESRLISLPALPGRARGKK
jgi:hypothetical protein